MGRFDMKKRDIRTIFKHIVNNSETFSAYLELKQKVQSLEVLKIQENSEHDKLTHMVNSARYLFCLFIFGFILSLFYFKNISSPREPIYFVIYLAAYTIFLILTAIAEINFVVFLLSLVINFLIAKIPKLAFLVRIPLFILVNVITYPFLFTHFITNMLGKQKPTDNFMFVIITLVIFLIVAWASSFVIVKTQSTFQFENQHNAFILINNIKDSVVLFLTGMMFFLPNEYRMFLTFIGFISPIIKLTINHEIKNRQNEAEEIFQQELKSDVPNYKELKRCYHLGGEKYKEKLLNNEKFSEVIKAVEGE